MTAVRRLEIRVNQTGDAQRGISKIAGSVGKIARVGLAAGKAAAGGIALLTGAVVVLGSKLSGLGAHAEEMQQKFDVVFGKGAPAAAKELDEFGNVVGRNKFALLEMASTMQDTFVPMGFARDKAAEMSIEMTKLAVDVGSFNDVLAPDVLWDFQAAIVGESETVRKYGIIITEARIKTKAAEMGLLEMQVSVEDVAEATAKLSLVTDKAALAQQKHTLVLAEHGEGSVKAEASAIRLTTANNKLQKAEDKLTEALAGEAGTLTDVAKVLARLQIIREGTVDAQGDATRTAASWTNQMLALTGAIAEGGTEMGLMLNEALLPLLHEFVPWVIDLMPKAVEVFKEFAENLSMTVGPAMALIIDAVFRIAKAFGVQTEDMSEADAVLKVFEKSLEAVVTAIELTAITLQALAIAVEWLTDNVPKAWVTLKQIGAITLYGLIIAIETVVDWWERVKITASQVAAISLYPLVVATQAVQNAVETVIGWWEDLKTTVLELSAISLYPIVLAVQGIQSAVETVISHWERLKTIALRVATISLLGLIGMIQAVERAVNTVISYWNNLKNAAINVANLSFHGIIGAIQGIERALDTVIGYFNDMKTAANNAINAIPDWLVPGSPTPFEAGLKGINQAAKDINLSMGMGKGERKPMAALGKAGQAIIINFTYSPVVSLADRYEAEEKLTPIILGALRTAGVSL